MFEVPFSALPLYTRSESALRLMVVTDGQHQRNEAAQHQGSHLHLAQSLPSVPSRGGVAVAAAPDLREDVDGGHVEEGAGGEEHGDASGVEVRQGLLAALRSGNTQKNGVRQNDQRNVDGSAVRSIFKARESSIPSATRLT